MYVVRYNCSEHFAVKTRVQQLRCNVCCVEYGVSRLNWFFRAIASDSYFEAELPPHSNIKMYVLSLVMVISKFSLLNIEGCVSMASCANF